MEKLEEGRVRLRWLKAGPLWSNHWKVGWGRKDVTNRLSDTIHGQWRRHTEKDGGMEEGWKNQRTYCEVLSQKKKGWGRKTF